MKITDENINRLVMAMFNLMESMKSRMVQCCVESGNLNEKEYHVISFIGLQQNVKMSEIADAITVPMSTLTNIVDGLVDQKILTRYNSDEDRRVVRVALTQTGNEAYGFFVKKKLDMANRILSNYSSSQQDDLIVFLENMPDALQ